MAHVTFVNGTVTDLGGQEEAAFDQPMFSREGKTDVGYVYCLSNPAMPGLVKIGYTNRSTTVRLVELSFGVKDGSATGVPLPFEIVKDWQVPGDKSVEIEQQIHRILQEFRVPAHGRWRAKEFFYLEPHQAVAAIEQALKDLDWWAVSQAEIARLDEELAARESRREAEVERQKVLAETEGKLKQEIADKQSQWREDAKLRKGEDGISNGLKWGLIWFVGSWVVLGMGGAKDSIGWFCLALGVIVYYATKDGPVNAYLSSQEARNELDNIDRKIRQRVAPASSTGIVRVEVTNSHAAINASSYNQQPRTKNRDFRQRFATAQDLDKQRRERQRLAVKDGWSFQVKTIEASPAVRVNSSEAMSPTIAEESNHLDVKNELKTALENKFHRDLIGGQIEKFSSLSNEHAAKAGLGTRLKLIVFLLENRDRVTYEKNICEMLQNSPPMRISPSQALAICRLVENDLRRQWGWPIHIEHQQTNNNAPFQAEIENGRVLAQDSLPDEIASGDGSHSVDQDSLAPKQLPALKKSDVTCPQCMTNLTASLSEAFLTQKIMCPSCAKIFLYKEGKRVAPMSKGAREDLENIYGASVGRTSFTCVATQGKTMKTPAMDQSKTTSKQPVMPSPKQLARAREIAVQLMANKAMRLAKKG